MGTAQGLTDVGLQRPVIVEWKLPARVEGNAKMKVFRTFRFSLPDLSFATQAMPRYLLRVTGFFKPNITRAGRIARAVWGVVVASVGVLAFSWKPWIAVVLFAASALALFEALRGWCLLRACGIRTKL